MTEARSWTEAERWRGLAVLVFGAVVIGLAPILVRLAAVLHAAAGPAEDDQLGVTARRLLHDRRPRAPRADEAGDGADAVALDDRLRVVEQPLRGKLEHDPERPRHIITVRGSGYRFDP